jgi:hypothetical protein
MALLTLYDFGENILLFFTEAGRVKGAREISVGFDKRSLGFPEMSLRYVLNLHLVCRAIID